MEYTLGVTLKKPRDHVVKHFLDTDSLKEWQDSLVELEHLSGTPRQVGAKCRQLHRMGTREIEMIETIAENDMSGEPQRFAAIYTAGAVWNLIANKFYNEGEHTRWELRSEFRCQGLMWLITKLMPGAFKKQTTDFMYKFREYVENV
jgi:hypothetical protein